MRTCCSLSLGQGFPLLHKRARLRHQDQSHLPPLGRSADFFKHLKRTRLHDHRIVSFARSGHHVSDTNTGSRGTFHVSACLPAATPDPGVRNQCLPQRHQTWADLIRCLVVLTISLLPPQVWSFHCKPGNCQSFFDSSSVGIDSSCTVGMARLAVTQVFSHWVCPSSLVAVVIVATSTCNSLCLALLSKTSCRRAASDTPFSLTQPFMSTSTASKIALPSFLPSLVTSTFTPSDMPVRRRLLVHSSEHE